MWRILGMWRIYWTWSLKLNSGRIQVRLGLILFGRLSLWIHVTSIYRIYFWSNLKLAYRKFQAWKMFVQKAFSAELWIFGHELTLRITNSCRGLSYVLMKLRKQGIIFLSAKRLHLECHRLSLWSQVKELMEMIFIWSIQFQIYLNIFYLKNSYSKNTSQSLISLKRKNLTYESTLLYLDLTRCKLIFIEKAWYEFALKNMKFQLEKTEETRLCT